MSRLAADIGGTCRHVARITEAGHLGLAHAPVATVLDRLVDGPVPGVDDARRFPEAVDRARVLDHGQPVHDRVGIDQLGIGKGRLELLVLVQGDRQAVEVLAVLVVVVLVVRDGRQRGKAQVVVDLQAGAVDFAIVAIARCASGLSR